MVKVAFSLLAFLGQDVAMISMLPLDSAGARQFETFLSAGLCLHFWHFTICFKKVLNDSSISIFVGFNYVEYFVFQL